MTLINDPFFGTAELPGLFEDLLNTMAMKRLARVHQSGAIFLVNSEICHSRLEHSIGVMLLIKKLGGTELEQVAGLLHDISHTAFSHVGDYVFDNHEEDYHEQIFEQVLLSSDIPEILSWHGYELSQIIEGDFKILEQPLPGLCADRLDYTLRDSYHAGLVTVSDVRAFINCLSLENGVITVTDSDKAMWINQLYQQLIDEVFNLPLHVYANRKLMELIKMCLTKGELTTEDLMKDDTYVLNKIRSSPAGYDGIKSIRQHKDFDVFVKRGLGLKMKHRQLNAFL